MSELCDKLHQLFATLSVHRFPFDQTKIPANGIYILFETGELAHGTNRVVRVGSHTGEDQLRSRLEQHFLNENKDRSIFRKNIGRAMLKRDRNDRFLKQWNIDLTTRKAKEEYSKTIDSLKQGLIEKQVTGYMQKHFWFIALGIPSKTKRLDLEKKLIATVSKCTDCQPSKDWLGRYSPKVEICTGKLWQVKDLNGTPLTANEYANLRKLIISQ
jgi:hypothetical protein